MNRFIRFLCASLSFFLVNGIWETLGNCLMKSPNDCPKPDRIMSLVGWCPDYNSGELSGFSQLAVFIHYWVLPSTSIQTS